MDTITFEKHIIGLDYSEQEYACAMILINGRPLIDIVREYELPYARKYGQENIAGGYMPICADYLLDLLTDKKKSEEYDRETPVLICQCGCEGCWDLLMTVVQEGAFVEWTNFHNPHRSSPTSAGGYWNYNDFPSFRFDKQEYQTAIARLKEICQR